MMRYLLADPARLRRIGLGFGLVILVAVLTLVNQKPWTPESLSGLNPWVLRLGTALVLALMVMANIRALAFLPRAAQVWAVWAELFVLLMAFFWSFDLSFSFIARKIGFLITQGLVTTLYISAVSIAIATVKGLKVEPIS